MWLTMTLFVPAFLAIVVWAIVTFTRYSTSRPPQHDHVEHGGDSTRILDERFARAEIEEGEYRKRKAVLQDEK